MLDLARRLEELRELGLHRGMRLVETPQGSRVVLDGREVLLLCSNNYLGLADDERVRRAAADAALRWGAGAGASRLVSGTMTIHRELEQRLAAFKRAEAVVLFGSGYLANVGVISALAHSGGVVLSDELNHASIVDGCRLARAETMVYRHRDVDHLASLLRHVDGRPTVVVTDSVFSMDGDVAPLADIAELAGRHGAALVVDEAHGSGCVGPGGRGAVVDAGLEGQVDVVVGTLGKALGSYGAYAAASARTVEYLVNRARSLIFSTAPGPPAVGAALAALDVLEDEPERVARLQANATVLRSELGAAGLETGESTTHIVPLLVGDAVAAVRVCEAALDRRVFAQAIRPPTVPDGTSRLRLAVMATHEPDELRDAARALAGAAAEAGLAPALA